MFPEVWPSWAYVEILPLSVACTCLFVLWCSLKWLYQVSQQHSELEKYYSHTTDEWTKVEIAVVGAQIYIKHQRPAETVETWLSGLTANLPPPQVLCWAWTFSQGDFKHSANSFLLLFFFFLKFYLSTLGSTQIRDQKQLICQQVDKYYMQKSLQRVSHSVWHTREVLQQEASPWNSLQCSSWCPLQSLFYDEEKSSFLICCSFCPHNVA